MCQLICLGSVEPLPESAAPQVRRVPELAGFNPNQYEDADRANADFSALWNAVPEARYFYWLGGCQCHFRHYSEAELADIYANELEGGDQAMAESTRAYYAAVAESVVATADYLADNLARTPIWLVWKWEGDAVSPDCVRWTRTPAYFRRLDFTMPEHEGVIELVPDAHDGRT